MKASAFLLAALISGSVFAKTPEGDYLVKIAKEVKSSTISTLSDRLPAGSQIEDLNFEGWVRVQLPQVQTPVAQSSKVTILSQPGVLFLQPNYRLRILEDFRLKDEKQRQAFLNWLETQAGGGGFGQVPDDNPAIPTSGSGGYGADPLLGNQWGMNQIGVKDGWKMSKGNPDIVVAVLDTGVDYTHEDLVDNMWRNPGEMGRDMQGRDKASNGVDDDKNGFIDDVVGWDFVSKDNKPYDMTTSIFDMLMGGGNPGHGTHCAGNVAARSDNGKGIAGVAPHVKIMALRFISEKGQGTTADAIGALNYAAQMGAKITSNSWGSEGEVDSNDPENKALRDAVRSAEQQGILFIAAAGNGRNGAGFNNDTDSKPSIPASYPDDIIISVAAVDEAGNLGAFSNWGARTVDIGAPGVKVFSTTPANNYTDKVIDFAGLQANWDGTSMATPHVAGAAALYWSLHPEATWRDVKNAILSSVKRTPAMQNKSTSGGVLDVSNLMSR